MDSALEEALERFDVAKLQESPDVVYAVDPELRLSFVNERYLRVANDVAQGEVWDRYPLGTRIVDGIERPLREHFTTLFEQALSGTAVVTTDYHCPTPQEHRLFRCTIYPLQGTGLLMVHGPLATRRWSDLEMNQMRDLHTELLPMCAGCRRVRSPKGEWIHVPQLLSEVPARATHGLCEACLGFYMGE